MNSNILIDIFEDVTKEGLSGVFGLTHIAKKYTGVSLVLEGLEKRKFKRFEYRVKDFIFAEEKLTEEERKAFFDDITDEQFNYFMQLFEIAYDSMYDIHAKILAKLYENLLINKELTYFEESLLANMKIFNQTDFLVFYKKYLILKLS